jgi:hypothetical protein
MSAVNVPDYLRKAKKASEKQGWLWEKREGSKHLMIFNPSGTAICTVSLTAYDGTLRKKVTSQLRRANCPGIQ